MSPDDVLQFWIGAPAPDHDSFMQKVRRWFGTDKALDAEIRTRFGRFCVRPVPPQVQSGLGGDISLAAPCASF